MDEGMILGRFMDSLLRGWLVIVLVVVACVGGAAAYTYSQPIRYRARALVATVRETTRISLGSDIVTLSEDELARASATAKERLQSFVAFVKSPAVAEQVVNELGNRLPEDLRNPDRLLALVEGRLAAGSDAIEVAVSARHAQNAAMIANAWAKAYVDQLNALYGGQDAAVADAIGSEVAEAATGYSQRQADLEAFLATDRRDSLNREISDYLYLLESLARVNRTSTLGEVAYQHDAYVSTLDELAAAQKSRLGDIILELRQVSGALRDASDLLAQVQAGGDAAVRSSQAAILLLKVRALAAQPAAVPPGAAAQLEVSLVLEAGSSTATVAETIADLQSLTATLQSRHTSLLEELQTLAEGQLSGDSALLLDVDLAAPVIAPRSGEAGGAVELVSDMIDEYQQLLNDARAERARQERRFLELETQRDLAWKSYDALLRHQTELAISDETTGAYVRLAVPATVPQAASRAVVRNLGLAAALGVILGVAAAWLIDFWRSYRKRSAEGVHAA